ncbi:polysaccharide biosynthesis protein [Streptomyces sp. SID8379]|uniref:Wzz/FepE/Etk N-terminal domain-containing protein n=1 Tax=unclassified Streptomyces TaxID=2593676 RepID=UPI00036A8A7F|nr:MULTISPECIES: Wzz/FepE/Etk N-terminal domain-containing protein [unclassified Streptomyces]MYW69736.1 polysaccharide biosynthesis protein [Streptomyces sp. SID8379]
MSEDTIRLVTIGRIFRRRRRLLAVLVVVGALVGLGASVVVFPPRYTTSASVLLPGQWEERELLTQVDVATSSSVLDDAADKLGWSGVDGGDLHDRVSAKAADGNIIKISGTAESPERAQQLADRVARQFVSFATRITGGGGEATTGLEDLRKQVENTNERISDLAGAADPGKTVESVEARTSLEKLRTSLEEAMQKLNEADPTNAKSGMVVMGSAARPTGEAAPTRTQLIVAGALLAFVLGIIGHLVAARVNRRLRAEPEIATALGAELIGTVDVPGERPAQRTEGGGRHSRVRRILGADTRWDVPDLLKSGDEAVRRTRYRRVCARLRDRLPAPRRLLVVVPDGDELGLRAAGQLVDEAHGDPVLRVVEVSVEHPMVPDRGFESGALVVLSAGTWTADELSGIAGACADSRHEVVGVVLADAVEARPTDSADRLADHDTRALAVRGQATGGTG